MRTAFIYITLLFIASTFGNWSYGVIFDAGSTSTKAYVYKWLSDQQGVPRVEAYTDVTQNASTKKSPGISTLTPSQVDGYLQPLIAWAASAVPPSQISTTEIYLKATAGMRLLPIAQQEAIIVACRNTLSASKFSFSSPENAKVISGTEEGIFGWIAVNYLKNNFFNQSAGTIGALDFGGASTQITYVADVPYISSNMVPLQVRGLQYQLYVYSYLGWGNDQIRNNKNIYITNNNLSVVNDPCSNVGYNLNFTTSNNRIVLLVGTGNATQCRTITKAMLQKTSVPDTSIDGNYQPAITDETFMAFSGYYYVKEYDNALMNQEFLQVQNYLQAAESYCSLPYSASVVNTVCSLIVSSYVLLHDAYGMDDTMEIDVPATINDVTITYALGAMIAEAALLEYDVESHNPVNDTIYAIMIDAGSSGSRIYVYYWPLDLTVRIPDVNELSNISEIASLSVKPGISSFVGNFAGLSSSLNQLISFAKQWIPSNKWPETYIYLYATAGMRLLTPPQQVQVIGYVNTVLSSSPFPVGGARIISGIEEGLFGWLAVNVLLNTLTPDQSTSVGTLDMGGASTQITFVPSYVPPAINHVPYQVGNKIYDTYTYSYLPYGNDQARNQQRDLLVKNNISADPCGNLGVVVNYTSTTGITRTLTGSGNFTACRLALLPILGLTPTVSGTSINGNFIPPVSSLTFYAFNGFLTAKVALSNMGLITNATNITNAQFRTAIQQYCATPNILKVSGDPYSSTNCFLMSYCSTLISDAYHFPDNQLLVFQGTIADKTVTWAFGAILHEATVFQEGLLDILVPSPASGPNSPSSPSSPAPSSSTPPSTPASPSSSSHTTPFGAVLFLVFGVFFMLI